jgi:hypothetical protein
VKEKTPDALHDYSEADLATPTAAAGGGESLQEGSARTYGAMQHLLAEQKHDSAVSSGLRKVVSPK